MLLLTRPLSPISCRLIIPASVPLRTRLDLLEMSHWKLCGYNLWCLHREEMSLNTEWHEAIVSVTVGAAWLCSLAAGFIAGNTLFSPRLPRELASVYWSVSDRVGRKAVILGASLVFTAGSLVLGFAQGKETLLVGRIIVGVAIGMFLSSGHFCFAHNVLWGQCFDITHFLFYFLEIVFRVCWKLCSIRVRN